MTAIQNSSVHELKNYVQNYDLVPLVQFSCTLLAELHALPCYVSSP